MIYDAIIIGGGPIGGKVAEVVAKAGYKVGVVEEHTEIGKPVQCAGLITPRVFDIVNANKSILNEVKGAHIYSPKGHKLTIESNETKGIIIDRILFDGIIIENAIHAGADVFTSTKAIKAERAQNQIKVIQLHKNRKRELKCKILIGADGFRSEVAKWFSLPRPKFMLSGYGREVSGIDMDSDFVKIFIGNNIAPGFFAWMIPTGNNVRIGLCTDNTDKSVYYYFKKLSEKKVSKLYSQPLEIIEYINGLVPIGVLDRTYADNIMIVGDAAAQVKATSGGGIYTGLKCALHCGNIAVKALELNDFSKNTLVEYQERWMDDIGKELKTCMRIHKIFRTLSDKQFEEIFKILDNKELLEIINNVGDIDYPSKVGWALLKKEPRLLKFIGPVFKSTFK